MKQKSGGLFLLRRITPRFRNAVYFYWDAYNAQVVGCFGQPSTNAQCYLTSFLNSPQRGMRPNLRLQFPTTRR